MGKPVAPSNQELTVLSLLWEQGPMTARAVRDAMPDGKARAYTSMLSVLQAMERKGLVTHTAEDGRNVYAATATKKQTLRPVLRDLVRDLFQGSPATALQHLLEGTQVTAEELAEIESLIAAQRKGKAAGKGKR